MMLIKTTLSASRFKILAAAAATAATGKARLSMIDNSKDGGKKRH